MKFQIKIDSDDAVFADAPEKELGFIFKKLTQKVMTEGLENLEGVSKIISSAGNTVGYYSVGMDIEEGI